MRIGAIYLFHLIAFYAILSTGLSAKQSKKRNSLKLKHRIVKAISDKIIEYIKDDKTKPDEQINSECNQIDFLNDYFLTVYSNDTRKIIDQNGLERILSKDSLVKEKLKTHPCSRRSKVPLVFLFSNK
jgi:hypothetical protein